ncbi:hypothetical protein BFF78_06625 [Streptomyces fodineus]|uniref:Uncharacterized protein n=1 Tax=Streptomyces fodineus TaxID=1904616 RepID=A0A1D7Y5B2_9ACTN|nr:hypothetical protein BFF78_06625 [Streptomyces fodineus]
MMLPQTSSEDPHFASLACSPTGRSGSPPLLVPGVPDVDADRARGEHGPDDVGDPGRVRAVAALDVRTDRDAYGGGDAGHEIQVAVEPVAVGGTAGPGRPGAGGRDGRGSGLATTATPTASQALGSTSGPAGRVRQATRHSAWAGAGS